MAARLLHRLEDVHAVPRERLKTQVLQPLTPRPQRIRRGSGDELVKDTAWMRLTQEQEAQGLMDQQKVFQHVSFFLVAITCVLCSRVVEARNGSLAPFMTNRGRGGGEGLHGLCEGSVHWHRGACHPERFAGGLDLATVGISQGASRVPLNRQ